MANSPFSSKGMIRNMDVQYHFIRDTVQGGGGRRHRVLRGGATAFADAITNKFFDRESVNEACVLNSR